MHGSSNFNQTLLKYDLVDEFWLKNFPLVLGTGKTLFAEGTIPAAFKCSEAWFHRRVIIANFKRAEKLRPDRLKKKY